jgi:hypothetical protein
MAGFPWCLGVICLEFVSSSNPEPRLRPGHQAALQPSRASGSRSVPLGRSTRRAAAFQPGVLRRSSDGLANARCATLTPTLELERAVRICPGHELCRTASAVLEFTRWNLRSSRLSASGRTCLRFARSGWWRRVVAQPFLPRSQSPDRRLSRRTSAAHLRKRELRHRRAKGRASTTRCRAGMALLRPSRAVLARPQPSATRITCRER